MSSKHIKRLRSNNIRILSERDITEPNWNNVGLAIDGLSGRYFHRNIRVGLLKFMLERDQQAMAENGLVFCSTTLTKGLLKANLLQQFETQSVKSDLCYYVPNKDSFETRSAVRFLNWIEDILNQ